jgi:hypothetical protein
VKLAVACLCWLVISLFFTFTLAAQASGSAGRDDSTEALGSAAALESAEAPVLTEAAGQSEAEDVGVQQDETEGDEGEPAAEEDTVAAQGDSSEVREVKTAGASHNPSARAGGGQSTRGPPDTRRPGESKGEKGVAEEDQGGAQDEAAGADENQGGTQDEQARPDQDEAESAGSVRRTLHAVTTSSDIRLDGSIDETVWTTADSIVDLPKVELEEGSVPAGQATVWVHTTASAIIIGILCHDAHPSGIVSFSKARDSDLEEEDHVLIVLDPFRDGGSGYVEG